MKIKRVVYVLLFATCMMTIQSLWSCTDDGPPYFTVSGITLKVWINENHQESDTCLYIDFIPGSYYAQQPSNAFFPSAMAISKSRQAGWLGAKEKVDSIHCYDMNRYNVMHPILSRLDDQVGTIVCYGDTVSLDEFNHHVADSCRRREIRIYSGDYQLLLPVSSADTARYRVEVFLDNGQHFDAQSGPILRAR